MRDKTTGRSRGFGFVTFADPTHVDAVMGETHTIDGRSVEVKRAVPKEDMGGESHNHEPVNGGAYGDESPPLRTKKVFVGGLHHSSSDTEFRSYFAQFGTITDAQVMTDRDTGKPRGFGFVSFDSEDTVDTVMNQTHEIGGKPVELKRAEPKRPLQLSVMRDKSRSGDHYSRDSWRDDDFRGGRDRGKDDLYGMNYNMGNIRFGYDTPNFQRSSPSGPPKMRNQNPIGLGSNFNYPPNNSGPPPRYGYPPYGGESPGTGYGFGGNGGPGFGGPEYGGGGGGAGGLGYGGGSRFAGGGPGYNGGGPGYGGGGPGYNGGGIPGHNGGYSRGPRYGGVGVGPDFATSFDGGGRDEGGRGGRGYGGHGPPSYGANGNNRPQRSERAYHPYKN